MSGYGSFMLDHGRERAGSWDDEDPMDTSSGGLRGFMRRLAGQGQDEGKPMRTHSISKAHRSASRDSFRGAGLGGFDG